MRYLIIVAIFTFLPGCGGGGNKNETKADSNTALLTAPIQVRTPMIGDHYKYSILLTDGLKSVAGNLDITYTNAITNNKGVECYVVEYATNLDSGISKYYKRIDDSGVYDCGFMDNNTGQNVFVDSATGLAKIAPNPINVGDLISPLIAYTDGSWEDCTYDFSSYKSVTVVAGNFDAFEVKSNCIESDGNSRTSIYWVDPVTGEPLKEEHAYEEGKRITAELDSYELKNISPEVILTPIPLVLTIINSL